MNLRKYKRNPISVAQLYISDNDISTSYTIVNIPSMYSPDTGYPVIYEIALYYKSNIPVYVEKHRLEKFQSKEIFIDKSYKFTGEAIVSITCKPATIFCKNDKHLGNITPHFYVKFHSNRSKSLGLVHPQTLLDAVNRSEKWTSGVDIEAQVVKKIVAYQINPTNYQFTNNLSLLNSVNSPKESKKYFLEMYSAEKKAYYMGSDVADYRFQADKLSTPNAKPLLFLYLNDGTFTVTHA